MFVHTVPEIPVQKELVKNRCNECVCEVKARGSLCRWNSPIELCSQRDRPCRHVSYIVVRFTCDMCRCTVRAFEYRRLSRTISNNLLTAITFPTCMAPCHFDVPIYCKLYSLYHTPVPDITVSREPFGEWISVLRNKKRRLAFANNYG